MKRRNELLEACECCSSVLIAATAVIIVAIAGLIAIALTQVN